MIHTDLHGLRGRGFAKERRYRVKVGKPPFLSSLNICLVHSYPFPEDVLLLRLVLLDSFLCGIEGTDWLVGSLATMNL